MQRFTTQNEAIEGDEQARVTMPLDDGGEEELCI